MLSMTGFGHSQLMENGYKFEITIKSVNAKFLDVEIKAPKSVLSKEEHYKKMIGSVASRGTIVVFISVSNIDSSGKEICIDLDLAKSIYDKTMELSNSLNVPANLSGKDIMRFNGVVVEAEREGDEELINSGVEKALIVAINDFKKAKFVEGENLKQDLQEKINLLACELDKVKIIAPLVQKEYYEKLKQRVQELLQGVEIDETKLVNEVAFFADKADINEEIVRLLSHITQFKNYINSDGPLGKKFEFLSQEMTREINTMGSKANNLELTKCVLNAKNINESIKEQIRNVE